MGTETARTTTVFLRVHHAERDGRMRVEAKRTLALHRRMLALLLTHVIRSAAMQLCCRAARTVRQES